MSKLANVASGRHLIFSLGKKSSRRSRAFCSTKIDTYDSTSAAHPDAFATRHIGPRNGEIGKLLDQLNVKVRGPFYDCIITEVPFYTQKCSSKIAIGRSIKL